MFARSSSAAVASARAASRAGAVSANRAAVVAVAPRAAFASNVVSPWHEVPMGPADPILGLTVAFKEDKRSNKINLGVGAYRGNDNKPRVLKCVSEAEKFITTHYALDHEYGPIVGEAAFRKLTKELVLGTAHPDILERTTTAQALSGTGALRVAAEYVKRWNGSPDSKWKVSTDSATGKPLVFMPNPTWANHHPLMADSGFSERKYRYYKADTCGLDIDGMLEDIKNAPPKSFFLFHTCAHNPTGVDPTPAQWAKIIDVCKERDHVALMDTAYQGFATGNIDGDAEAVRAFAKAGIPILIAQSFAKNMGLYGHRVGAVSVIGADKAEADRIDSQMKILIRPMYSNPPIHGSKIVQHVLGSADLRSLWVQEVKEMADRIIDMRKALKAGLEAEGSTRDWSHVTKQIGMFCFSGLKPEECDALRENYGIYLTRNGRISVAGITTSNIGHLCKGIADVTNRK